MPSHSGSRSGAFNTNHTRHVVDGSPMSWRPDFSSAPLAEGSPMSWKPDSSSPCLFQGSPMSWQANSFSAQHPQGSTSGRGVSFFTGQRQGHLNLRSPDHSPERVSSKEKDTDSVLEFACRRSYINPIHSFSSLRAPFKKLERFRCPNSDCCQCFEDADMLKVHVTNCEPRRLHRRDRSDTAPARARSKSLSAMRRASKGMLFGGFAYVKSKLPFVPTTPTNGDPVNSVDVESRSSAMHPSSWHLDPDETRLRPLAGVVTRLVKVFDHAWRYRRLLQLRNSDAQLLLDTFQALLDSNNSDPDFRRNLLVATQRLSKSAHLYPASYNLEDITLESSDPVAAGGFADIYKGSSSGMDVCIKAVRLYQTSDVGSFFKQFSAEAVLWSQLSHPNLLPFYGLCQYNGRPCLVSPWMKHGDINKYLFQCPGADRNLLISDIASGLAYLHDINIVHGDLKGVNTLVDSYGRVCLADFGLSAISDSKILHWTSHSSAASKGGTARWQAPELFNYGTDEIVHNSKASDIYAAACVMYEVFTGNVPFFEQTRETAILLAVSAGAKPSRPPESSSAWVSWGLTEYTWSIMEAGWSRDPTHRPSVHEILVHFKALAPVDSRPNMGVRSLCSTRLRDTLAKLPPVGDIESLLDGIYKPEGAPCNILI